MFLTLTDFVCVCGWKSTHADVYETLLTNLYSGSVTFMPMYELLLCHSTSFPCSSSSSLNLSICPSSLTHSTDSPSLPPLFPSFPSRHLLLLQIHRSNTSTLVCCCTCCFILVSFSFLFSFFQGSQTVPSHLFYK